MEMTIRINYYDESADNFEYHTLYEEDFQNGRPPIYSLMTEIIDRYEEDEWAKNSYDVIVLQSNKKYCVVFQSRTVAEARKYIAENNLEYFDEKVRHNPYFRRTKVVKNPFHFVWNTANDVDYKR